MKEITTKTKPSKILKMFKDAFDNGKDINFKVRDGFIYYAGGILNKIEGKEHYVAIGGNWVKL